MLPLSLISGRFSREKPKNSTECVAWNNSKNNEIIWNAKTRPQKKNSVSTLKSELDTLIEKLKKTVINSNELDIEIYI